MRTFGTMTCDLLQLVDWLGEGEVTHVAMESTGEYWKPVYNLLEGNVEVLLVNAQHVKHVPGRKTNVKDAEWLAELLVHGLLKASFIPANPQRNLRDLTRYRVNLVEERAGDPLGALAISLYHMLDKQQPYQELGADYFDQRSKGVKTDWLLKQLNKLGYTVQLEPVSAPA
ncbi:MAG: transposase [Caldilineaceae bacterium]